MPGLPALETSPLQDDTHGTGRRWQSFSLFLPMVERGRLSFHRFSWVPQSAMIRLFRVSIPAGVLVLLISEMLLTSLCFILAAFIVLRHYDYDLATYFIEDGGLARMALVVLSIILRLHLN